MDQIGTGEGAQAYGHGLYFADAEDVAKGYQETLSNRVDSGFPARRLTLDGIEIDPKDEELHALAEHVKILGKDGAREVWGSDPLWQKIENAEIGQVYDGALYRTEIDVTPESLLDWDAMLDEQPQAVQEALESSDWWDYAADDLWSRDSNPTGRDLVRYLSDDGPEFGSQQLNDRGIKGIKYLDGDSRAVGDGTSNYVIFDDSLINIAERGNADPRLLAGTAAATAGALAAPMVKDSGMISSPRAGWLWDTTMALRDVERRLEGHPAGWLFPGGLVDYLETTNRREEKPNAETAAWALLDVFPW
jgi:hypothetical protein